jgi:hypothetical protein
MLHGSKRVIIKHSRFMIIGAYLKYAYTYTTNDLTLDTSY